MGLGEWSFMGRSLSSWLRFCGSLSGWFRRLGRCGSASGGRSRSYGPPRPCSGGTSPGASAYLAFLSAGGQVWEKPLTTQVTRPWAVNRTGVCPR